MNQYSKIFSYYILLVLGFVGTSWIIRSRFLRERVISDIPDGLFTELRFWILFYICLVYAYTIKQYIKPNKTNIFLTPVVEIFYIPLTILDHTIKYNKYIRSYYYIVINKVIIYLSSCNRKQLEKTIFIFEVLPRVMLVCFLLLDCFYFQKLEIFYKIILIGLVPFIWRYINYCLKDIIEHWIKLLEDKYDFILVYEKGREFMLSDQWETPKYHNEQVNVREYIEINYENINQNLNNKYFSDEYTGIAFAKDTVYKSYRLKLYDNADIELSKEDNEKIRALFHQLTDKIFELKKLLIHLANICQDNSIKSTKILVFSLYFISWSFVLISSYYYYPVKFDMFNYFCSNIEKYFMFFTEPFALLEQYSFNKNLITIENIKALLKTIWENISSRWK